MTHKIIDLSDENLRNVCTEVEDFEDEDLQNYIKDFAETFANNADWMGLASNQVGGDKRIIGILLGQNMPIILINPKITSSSEYRVSDNEACLSVPRFAGQVWRFTDIVLEFQDAKGQQMVMKFEGSTARVIQHEIDHLDGIVFLDRVEQKKVITISSDGKKCMIPVEKAYKRFGTSKPEKVMA